MPEFYLNRDQQEKFLSMALAMVTLGEVANETKFKKGAGDLRRASSFARRGFNAVREQLDYHDQVKMARIAHNTKVIYKPLTAPDKNEAVVKSETLAQLISFAIHNHCTDCTIKDWKKCPLRATLMDAYCPSAQDTRSDCQYRQ